MEVMTITVNISAPLATLRAAGASVEPDLLAKDFRGEIADLGLRFSHRGSANNGDGSDLPTTSIAGDYVVVIPAGKLELITAADGAGEGDAVNI